MTLKFNGFIACPFEKCNVILRHSFVLEHLIEENKPTYIKQICQSFTEENKHIKFCPAPGCPFCVENIEADLNEVICKCKNVFCFKCGEEGHRYLFLLLFFNIRKRPCICEQVKK